MLQLLDDKRGKRVAILLTAGGEDDTPLMHEFKNHLSVIIGFCDLLLRDLPEDDPKRADILEMRNAGRSAIALLPELSERMR